ncbi:MAG TPA: type I phosphomannose isomerase catalytic subunit [Terriglobales bacterium]|jgi:mannose-6-phosphate isomerase|nr:type I phosphomannose isomerase catalytic subunit [Terriglobales bacterium]
MSALYPFLLRPEFVERPWGARDLSPIYPEHPCGEPVGEVWLTGDDNRVANGPLAGRTLGELCRQYGRALVGESARETDRFPLLIKFLFSREKLSVQVHPDDETARRAGLPCGKTECWYVVTAEPGAQVALGLKSGVTREQLARAIRSVQAEELLNWVDIHAGEMIYVDAGTVHTIGPGAVLLETQQNSDTTYRLYDYGRPREIHVEQGLAATKERTRAGKVRRIGSTTALVASPSFVVEKLGLGEMRRFEAAHSPQIFVTLEGSGVAEGPSPASFSRGEVLVVPASAAQVGIRPHRNLQVLRMTLPVGATPEPETTSG